MTDAEARVKSLDFASRLERPIHAGAHTLQYGASAGRTAEELVKDAEKIYTWIITKRKRRT